VEYWHVYVSNAELQILTLVLYCFNPEAKKKLSPYFPFYYMGKDPICPHTPGLTIMNSRYFNTK